MCLPFCHKYETVNMQTIEVYWDATDEPPMYHKLVYILKCTKCGWVKKRVLKT